MWATTLFVLPAVLVAWLIDGIKYMVRQNRLNSEAYEWNGVVFRRGDRVVTVETELDKEIPKCLRGEDAGYHRDLYFGAGHTGTVKCGDGSRTCVVIIWDAQEWREYDSATVIRLPAFEDSVAMDYLVKA